MDRRVLGGLVVLAFVVGSAGARAGVILVSGDLTPVFYLTDTDPNPATPGNRRFFTNALAGGDHVAVLDSAHNPFSAPEINAFYGALPGVTSNLLSGPVDAGDLAGLDLFLAPAPDHAFAADEVIAIQGLVDAGGSVFLLGEALGIPFGVSANASINALLAALGSGLAIVDASLERGSKVASGAQILADPLTSGVTAFDYGFTSEVSGGAPLFLTGGGIPFLAYEVVQSSPPPSIPEPPSLLLVAAALFGLGVGARRPQSQRSSLT